MKRATPDDAAISILSGISANGRDCKHGQLARSCEICELEEDLALAKFFLATMHPKTEDYCACSVCDFLERV